MTLQQAVFKALGWERLKVDNIHIRMEVVSRQDTRNGSSMRVEVTANAVLDKGSFNQIVMLTVAAAEYTYKDGLMMHDMSNDKHGVPRVRFDLRVTDPVLAKQFWDLAAAESPFNS